VCDAASGRERVCLHANTSDPINADCSIWVTDPAVSANAFQQVAAAVFVNGQAVDRIDVYGNGLEIGQFRMTADGRIQ
jgi:hypothetical protein